MNNKKWHITIRENETNEVVLDTDAVAIIGGIANGEDTHRLGLINCTGIEILHCISEADEAKFEIMSKHPELFLASLILDSTKRKKDEE